MFRQPVHVLELYFATQGSRATSLSFHRWPASNTVRSVRRLVIRLLFIPSLIYNLVLERLLPSRRWWDQVEDHVLLGALPLPWIVDDMAAAGVAQGLPEELAMQLAKPARRNPRELAQLLADHVKANADCANLVDAVEIAVKDIRSLEGAILHS